MQAWTRQEARNAAGRVSAHAAIARSNLRAHLLQWHHSNVAAAAKQESRGDTRLGARSSLDATALDDDDVAMLATLMDELARARRVCEMLQKHTLVKRRAHASVTRWYLG